MQTAIPCRLMRGGTSKGLFFLAGALPTDRGIRDAVLLAAMGSPDPRQIDGLGGAHPLTSKIAVVGPSSRPDADVDYLFLQAAVDRAQISDAQNCGNLLAAVGPFALDTGLLEPADGVTDVHVHLVNTGGAAVVRVQTPKRTVTYAGEARIDGVPGSAAPVMLEFLDVAGSSCGALLPTGHVVDSVDGVEVTCIDNGMPVVIVAATDLGKTGHESPQELEADQALTSRVEGMRKALGPRMNLGDVTDKTVPKMCLVGAPIAGGLIGTRTFIPHRVHEAIGVLGAVSVATACRVAGSVAERVARTASAESGGTVDVEHPTGFFSVEVEVTVDGGAVVVGRAALLRTARLLMRGEVLIPASLWSGP